MSERKPKKMGKYRVSGDTVTVYMPMKLYNQIIDILNSDGNMLGKNTPLNFSTWVQRAARRDIAHRERSKRKRGKRIALMQVAA